MIQINYRDSRPIYEQIKDSFRKLIQSGVMKRDEKMPSVRSLAQGMSINPNTIQKAYNELETEGYIYSVPGKGSFVLGEASKNPAKINELFEKLQMIVSELRYMGVSQSEIIRQIEAAEAAGRSEEMSANEASGGPTKGLSEIESTGGDEQ